MVTERVIDNRIDEHVVVDFRVSIMDGHIVCTERRYWPISDRFRHSGANMVALVIAPDEAFSRDEQARLVAICSAMGADWADLDVLRDQTTGRIYVVDVNPTPAAPTIGLAGAELAAYWNCRNRDSTRSCAPMRASKPKRRGRASRQGEP